MGGVPTVPADRGGQVDLEKRAEVIKGRRVAVGNVFNAETRKRTVQLEDAAIPR
jgi:hypothetical protein